MSSTLAKYILYLVAASSGTCALGHTKMGYDVVFPALKKLGVKDVGAISARIGWMEVNQGFIILSIFAIKWAQYGITDVYDKVFAGFYCAAQFYFGWCYLKAGIKEPVVPLWGIPSLVALSQLV